MRHDRFGWALALVALLGLFAWGCGDSGSSCGDCNDNIDCTQDSCDEAAKTCRHEAIHALCPADQVCDPNQGCVATPPCTSDVECDDQNACTDDHCNPASGCEYTNNTAACDDGNACTENEACSAGSCSGGSQVGCNDSNPCTDDTCNPASGCQHANNSAVCNDSNACTTSDVCSGGSCGGTAVVCSDGNECTDDACDPASGCSYTDNTATCEDGNLCTEGDTCSGGSCVSGGAVNCDDSNVCTTDSCNPASGCAHADNTLACDDGDACTRDDACAGGACAGTAITCDDDNICTDDSCDPASGCVFANNTAACDDGNSCTANDACAGGTCVGGTNTCTCSIDSDCDPYEDGNLCNGTLHCDGSNLCSIDPATVVTCDPSGNTACQRNTCNPVDGQCAMQNINEGGQCNDASACTHNDVCTAGTCAGTAITCDDGEPCTTDTCDPATGCVFTNNTIACDDGSACTENDACANGTCSGTAVSCDDDNVCTTDSCNPASGCAHTNNTVACDDGDDLCTVNDHCAAGACHGAESCCGDTADNDGDGAADCLDSDCTGDPLCTSYTVDWCNLQYPATIDAGVGEAVLVYGRLYIDGLTNVNQSGNDPAAAVVAEVGYGVRDSDPTAGGWNWLSAAPNPGWDGTGAPNNDEYMAELLTPAAGSYDYAYRFSGDGGSNWTYCDLDGSTTNGYTAAQAGKMTTTAGACTGTIAAVRAAADGAVDPPICLDAVRVTYVRPTGSTGNGFYIQKAQAGPAIYVFTNTEVPTVAVGNTLQLTVSEVGSYNELKEVTGFTIVTNDGLAGAVTDLVQDFTAGGAIGEDAESELVRIDNALVLSGSGSNWVVSYAGGAQTVAVYSPQWSTVSPCPGMSVSLQAPAGQFNANYQLTAYAPEDFLAHDAAGCTKTVGWCRLQWPSTISGDAGTTADVYGRVYVAGLTDVNQAGNDPWPSVVGQVGYGPDGATPDDTWVWVDGEPNPAWDGAGEPNNDEYMATLTLPGPGGSPYDYAYRFSGDGGTTWLYCDLDGATIPAEYDPAQAGDLQVTGGSAVNLFFSEYVEGQSNNKALEIYNAGAGDVDLSTCQVRFYPNGAVTPGNTIALTGTLAAAGVFVLCDDSADAAILAVCDLQNTGTFYNGDDNIDLVCNGVIQDIFGQYGIRPQNGGWFGSTTNESTQNNTWARKCTVTVGDMNGSDPFDPDSEWDVLGVDVFTGLGARSCP